MGLPLKPNRVPNLSKAMDPRLWEGSFGASVPVPRGLQYDLDGSRLVALHTESDTGAAPGVRLPDGFMAVLMHVS